jgi:hypothetical protein
LGSPDDGHGVALHTYGLVASQDDCSGIRERHQVLTGSQFRNVHLCADEKDPHSNRYILGSYQADTPSGDDARRERVSNPDKSREVGATALRQHGTRCHECHPSTENDSDCSNKLSRFLHTSPLNLKRR